MRIPSSARITAIFLFALSGLLASAPTLAQDDGPATGLSGNHYLAYGIVMTSREYLNRAYVAYYGRPPDPAGEDHWASIMDPQGASHGTIIVAFRKSDEFNRRYGGLSPAAYVTKIYQQVLGRDPDPEGLAYYLDALDAGRRSLVTIPLDMLGGATTAPDSIEFASKLVVATYYTAAIRAGCPYGSEQDGVNILAGVTADQATVAAAKSGIDSRCSP